MTAFVSPATGECFWYISSGISKPFFEAPLATFAEETGAGRDRIIVLVLDNAGWRSESNLVVPKGSRLVFLPPYTPELQPAEHLRETVDAPIVDKYIPDFETLEAIISERCAHLANDRPNPKSRASFHWWPPTANAS